MTSLATIVVRRPSRATSLAQAVRYNIKIPEARERADRESLEMLVDFGRVCLRRRRMQAAGGSKSEEEEEEVEVLVVDDADLDFGFSEAVAVDVDCSVAVAVAMDDGSAAAGGSSMVAVPAATMVFVA
mmetsp:Transcript_28304/g.40453  ORF Transcript_28304/g.40453 Transcript_28304/m.40453 type:complete len:128 (+) Transcript_28304:565-948(+)